MKNNKTKTDQLQEFDNKICLVAEVVEQYKKNNNDVDVDSEILAEELLWKRTNELKRILLELRYNNNNKSKKRKYEVLTNTSVRKLTKKLNLIQVI